MTETLVILETIALSTLLYAYLHKKTRISLKYLYLDNLAVILPVAAGAWCLSACHNWHPALLLLIVVPALVPGLAFAYTMIRFWRTPRRKVKAALNEIISPADGNVIYIKKIEAGTTPISIKNGRSFVL